MKTRTLSSFAGVAGALIFNSNATGSPQLALVSWNITNAFLVANGLQSVVIGVTGFAQGENLQGFIGTSTYPWVIGNPAGSFFNVNSNYPYFDGQGQTAATALNAPPNGQWDSGVIANPTTNSLGAITSSGLSNPIGFAQFGVGQNSGPGSDVYWLSQTPQGIPITGTVPLFRITWPKTTTAYLFMLLVTNTGGGHGGEHYVDMHFVPAPGCLGVFAMAAMVGMRRRRE